MARTKRSAFSDQVSFAQLRSHLEIAAALRTVKWEHRLGELTDKLCPRKSRGYGQGNIELLAKELEDPTLTANRLWLARKLSVAISARELNQMLVMAAKADFDLTISHVLALVSLKDETQRYPIGKQCIEAAWSVKQLRREIHRRQKKQSSGGAALKEPDSVDEALRDLVDRSRDWVNRAQKIWFGSGAGCLARPMAKSTANRIAAELEEAESVLTKLSEEVEAARQALHAQPSWPFETSGSESLRSRATKKRHTPKD